jgi:hypothetical protein
MPPRVSADSLSSPAISFLIRLTATLERTRLATSDQPKGPSRMRLGATLTAEGVDIRVVVYE